MYLFICHLTLFCSLLLALLFCIQLPKCKSYNRQFAEFEFPLIWLPHRREYSMIISKLTGTAFFKQGWVFFVANYSYSENILCNLWYHILIRPPSIILGSTRRPLTSMLLSFLMHMYVCIYIYSYKYSKLLDVLGMVIVKITYTLCCTYFKTRPKAQHGLQINNFSGKFVRCVLCV